ncbi:DUF3152 domain-containing protein [Streptomyces sp. NBC_01497]|uniref:DUF3152 domain-containing protein n=1 Tax=Streptomyces sp. NBC_01497 TaxID=2903885 RepID=UPI002E326D97|nr:DUF3152 domain-containing protein [Streptomyces sp. NBC_01497]
MRENRPTDHDHHIRITPPTSENTTRAITHQLERPTSKPTPPSPPSAATEVLATGRGTFSTAQASGWKVGHGTKVLRYRVEVENGIDLSLIDATDQIADILTAPQGWTRNGVSSFQLVSGASLTTSM